MTAKHMHGGGWCWCADPPAHEVGVAVSVIVTERGQRMIDRQLTEEAGPVPAPRNDARCWPHPCRDYHSTYSHQSGEDPCACACHRSAK